MIFATGAFSISSFNQIYSWFWYNRNHIHYLESLIQPICICQDRHSVEIISNHHSPNLKVINKDFTKTRLDVNSAWLKAVWSLQNIQFKLENHNINLYFFDYCDTSDHPNNCEHLFLRFPYNARQKISILLPSCGKNKKLCNTNKP